MARKKRKEVFTDEEKKRGFEALQKMNPYCMKFYNSKYGNWDIYEREATQWDGKEYWLRGNINVSGIGFDRAESDLIQFGHLYLDRFVCKDGNEWVYMGTPKRCLSHYERDCLSIVLGVDAEQFTDLFRLATDDEVEQLGEITALEIREESRQEWEELLENIRKVSLKGSRKKIKD